SPTRRSGHADWPVGPNVSFQRHAPHPAFGHPLPAHAGRGAQLKELASPRSGGARGNNSKSSPSPFTRGEGPQLKELPSPRLRGARGNNSRSPRSRGPRGHNSKSSPSSRSRGEGARRADEGRVIKRISV